MDATLAHDIPSDEDGAPDVESSPASTPTLFSCEVNTLDLKSPVPEPDHENYIYCEYTIYQL